MALPEIEESFPNNRFFLSENYDDRSFIRYKNVGRSFFRFITMHAFDGQTVGQTDFDSKTVRMHSRSHGNNEVC